jgi:hypothetical protein
MEALQVALKELLEQRAESLALGGEGDEEVAALQKEIEQEIHRAAARVLAASGITVVTAGAAGAVGSEQATRPLEVLWDDGRWYACYPTELKYDFARMAPVAMVSVVGYGQTSAAKADQLRPWTKPADPLQPGSKAHACHPRTGKWQPCVIERLTMRGLVGVRFTDQAPAPAQPTAPAQPGTLAPPPAPDAVIERAELQPWEVTMGKVHPFLRKKPENMTAEEKVQAEEEDRKRKRERTWEKKEAANAKLEAQAGAWHDFVQQVGLPQPPPVGPVARKGPPKQR